MGTGYHFILDPDLELAVSFLQLRESRARE
jgi:hypothetical protein